MVRMHEWDHVYNCLGRFSVTYIISTLYIHPLHGPLMHYIDSLSYQAPSPTNKHRCPGCYCRLYHKAPLFIFHENEMCL